MTRDEIMKIQPGRELDVLVAEKVMGYEYVPYQLNGRYVGKDYFINKDGEPLYDWSPSTDIAAAWEVETKAIENDPSMYVHALASVVFGYNQVQDISDIRKMCLLIHATPEQRCKAALLAVMGEALVHELSGTNQC